MRASGTGIDRAGAVRAALRRLVAAHGFHGASMSAVDPSNPPEQRFLDLWSAALARACWRAITDRDVGS